MKFPFNPLHNVTHNLNYSVPRPPPFPPPQRPQHAKIAVPETPRAPQHAKIAAPNNASAAVSTPKRKSALRPPKDANPKPSASGFMFNETSPRRDVKVQIEEDNQGITVHMTRKRKRGRPSSSTDPEAEKMTVIHIKKKPDTTKEQILCVVGRMALEL